MFASIFITVKSIQKELADNQFSFSTMITNEIFFNLIVSMCSTYLLYLIVSLLFFDPWHMVTSVCESVQTKIRQYQNKGANKLLSSSSNIS